MLKLRLVLFHDGASVIAAQTRWELGRRSPALAHPFPDSIELLPFLRRSCSCINRVASDLRRVSSTPHPVLIDMLHVTFQPPNCFGASHQGVFRTLGKQYMSDLEFQCSLCLVSVQQRPKHFWMEVTIFLSCKRLS